MHEVRVERNEAAAIGLRLLTLDLSLAGYTRPGQYVLAHVGHHLPAFFAIASSPGEPLMLLVKDEPETTAQELVRMVPGAQFALSDAQGPGFSVEEVAGREFVVLVNGSGISAVRPVLNAEVAAGLERRVHLYFGVVSPAHRAFPWELERWGNAGVQVHTVVDPAGASGWYGATGYVQEVAQAHGLVRDDVGVLLCGLPIMLEQARALWEGAGVPPERILVNF